MFNLLYLNSISLQILSELLEFHFPVEVTIGLVQDLLQSLLGFPRHDLLHGVERCHPLKTTAVLIVLSRNDF